VLAVLLLRGEIRCCGSSHKVTTVYSCFSLEKRIIYPRFHQIRLRDQGVKSSCCNHVALTRLGSESPRSASAAATAGICHYAAHALPRLVGSEVSQFPLCTISDALKQAANTTGECFVHGSGDPDGTSQGMGTQSLLSVSGDQRAASPESRGGLSKDHGRSHSATGSASHRWF